MEEGRRIMLEKAQNLRWCNAMIIEFTQTESTLFDSSQSETRQFLLLVLPDFFIVFITCSCTYICKKWKCVRSIYTTLPCVLWSFLKECNCCVLGNSILFPFLSVEEYVLLKKSIFKAKSARRKLPIIWSGGIYFRIQFFDTHVKSQA